MLITFSEKFPKFIFTIQGTLLISIGSIGHKENKNKTSFNFLEISIKCRLIVSLVSKINPEKINDPTF